MSSETQEEIGAVNSGQGSDGGKVDAHNWNGQAPKMLSGSHGATVLQQQVDDFLFVGHDYSLRIGGVRILVGEMTQILTTRLDLAAENSV